MARENIGESILGYIVLGVIFFIIIYPWILGIIALIVIIAVLVNIYNSRSITKKKVVGNYFTENMYNTYDKGLNDLEAKDFKSAIKNFTKAISSNIAPVPIDDVYVYRGIAYANLNMNAEAKADFSKAIDLFSYDNSTAYLERGKIFLKEKDYNKAIQDFNTAIKMNYENNGDDYYYRGLAYIQIGERENAIKDLSKAIKLLPQKNNATKDKCLKILDKLKIKENGAKTTKLSTKIVKLKTCTKNSILTLAGFNEKKANLFIKLRDEGKMWYDIDTFVFEFNIQPHEMLLIQDRIQFPPKPKVKSGRKIDI